MSEIKENFSDKQADRASSCRKSCIIGEKCSGQSARCKKGNAVSPDIYISEPA